MANVTPSKYGIIADSATDYMDKVEEILTSNFPASLKDGVYRTGANDIYLEIATNSASYGYGIHFSISTANQCPRTKYYSYSKTATWTEGEEGAYDTTPSGISELGSFYPGASTSSTADVDSLSLSNSQYIGSIGILTGMSNDVAIWSRGIQSYSSLLALKTPNVLITNVTTVDTYKETSNRDTIKAMLIFDGFHIPANIYGQTLVNTGLIDKKVIPLTTTRFSIITSLKEAIIPVIITGSNYICDNLYYFSNTSGLPTGTILTDGSHQYRVIGAGDTSRESLLWDLGPI